MSARAQTAGHREALRRAVHDLRNPLAVLRASLGWLESELAANETVAADAHDAVSDCSLATLQLVRLVDDLSLLVQLDEPLAASPVPIVLGPIVEAAARAAAAEAGKGTTVVVVPRPFDEARFVARGDVVQLTRAIEAALAAVVRGASPRTRLEVSAELTSDGLRIVFGADGDDGPFRPHDKLAGSGLALHVASRIAAAHGGDLEIAVGARAPRIVLTLR